MRPDSTAPNEADFAVVQDEVKLSPGLLTLFQPVGAKKTKRSQCDFLNFNIQNELYSFFHCKRSQSNPMAGEQREEADRGDCPAEIVLNMLGPPMVTAPPAFF